MSITNIKSETELSHFGIVFRGSCLNEYKGIYGASHLSEHLVCKAIDIMQDEFDADGITFNAYTTSKYIYFYISGLDEYVNKHKYEFLQNLNNFNITEEEFQNEKKIVLEEFSDSFNKQGSNHALNLMRKLFDYYNPIGLREDLQKMTLKDIQKFVKLQYSKPHQIINVSKYNDFKENIDFSTDVHKKTFMYDIYDSKIEKENDFKGKSSIINLSKIVTEDFGYVKFICSMLGTGLKSPLMQEVREKRGLVYHISCSMSSETDDTALIWIEAETSNNNINEFQETVAMVLNNPKKYMTKERFDIIKKSYEIQFKKSEINRYNNVTKYIDDPKFQVETILKSITLDKVMKVYDKYFNFDDYYKSIDKEEFDN